MPTKRTESNKTKTRSKTSLAAKKLAGKKPSPSKASKRAKTTAKKATSSRTANAKLSVTAPSLLADNAEHESVTIARGLASIVEEHGLSELIVDSADVTFTVRRGVAVAPSAPQMLPTMMAAPSALVAQTAHVAEPVAANGVGSGATSSQPSEGANGEFHLVTSPFVGTFYRSPNPDAQPYVEVGQRVEKGQVMCIVEAMKLMNEIEADVSGVVAFVLVDDAQAVEYGQPLFRISPS